MFDTVLQAKTWEAEREHQKRHSRPTSQDALLAKFGAVRIADLGDPGPDPYLIQDFLPEGEPVYFYGARGSLKSYDTTMMAIAIASPGVSRVFGREVEKHGTTIIFDSEMNPRRYNQRIKALCRGLEVDVPQNLIYKSAVGVSPTESFPELHEMVEVFGAIFVVIGSLGFSTRSKPEDYNEQRNDAADYINPILRLGATPAIVDHKPHKEDHLFGSVAKEYHGRGIFQVIDRDQSDREDRRVRQTRLLNEKLSHGPDRWGVDLKTTFEMIEDEKTGTPVLYKVTMEAEDAAGGGFVRRSGKEDSWTKVKRSLREGDKTLKEIALRSGVAEKTLEKLLPKRGETKNEVYVAGKSEGRGGALLYSILPGDEGSKIDPSNSRTLPFPAPGGGKGEGTSSRGVKNKKGEKSQGSVSLLEHARANRELSKNHNLIYRQKDVAEVLAWLKELDGVAVDTETHSVGAKAEVRRKKALSFTKGKVRLLQLSDGETTYLIDTLLLKPTAVAAVLEALHGKVLYGHNLIFDLPRLRRHFGVNLLDEEVRDTMVLSRLIRAGEWEENEEQDAVSVRHRLGEVLRREEVVIIPKETDHAWQGPLTDERLTYATDDVRYLPELANVLTARAEEQNLEIPLEQYKTVYRMYMHMQYNGQPVDEARLQEYVKKLEEKVAEALARIEEHKPPHPDGGEWSWLNKRAYEPKKAQK